MWKLSKLTFLAITALSLSGCSVTTGKSIPSNQSFVSRLTDEIRTPDKKFDPNPAAAYGQVTVLDENGKSVTLYASSTPLLYEAYWCPHCQRTIVLLYNHRSALQRLPLLISTGFQPGTTLSQAEQITREEFNQLQVSGFQVYYLLASPGHPLEFPTMAFNHDGKSEILQGEHTLTIWQTALS